MRGAVDEEASYYQAVEEYFVSRRGDPLVLSNADWTLARTWRVAGIPLRVVLRGIADAFDSHDHSFSRDSKVGSLRYCSSEVERARDRWEHALGGSQGGEAELLGRLASSLRSAATLPAASLEEARRIAAALEERSAEPGSPRELEEFLQTAEASLLKALATDLGEKYVQQIRQSIAEELRPYSGRMPEKVLGQVAEDALARRLLESHSLSRMSLFHL